MTASSIRVEVAAGEQAKLATDEVGGLHTLKTTAAVTAGSGASMADLSINSATGASQQIVAADANRSILNISNPGTASWWINESGGTAAAAGFGCFELRPGDRWTPRPAPTNAVTGIGTAASKLTVVVN